MIIPKPSALVLGRMLSNAANMHAQHLETAGAGGGPAETAKQTGAILITLAELTAELLTTWPDDEVDR